MPVWEGTPAQIEAAADAVWKTLNEHRPIPLSAAECRDAALAALAAAEKAKPKISTGGVGAGPMVADAADLTVDPAPFAVGEEVWWTARGGGRRIVKRCYRFGVAGRWRVEFESGADAFASEVHKHVTSDAATLERQAFTPAPWIGPGVYEVKDGGFVKLDTPSEAAAVTIRRAAAIGEDWFPHNGAFSLTTHPVEVMTRSGEVRRGSGFKESQFLWNLNARSSEDIVAYRPA